MSLLVFWSCCAIVFVVYVGYPLLLYTLGSLAGRNVRKGNTTFGVSILISAYNEEEHIGATVKNKLSLNVAPAPLEIIVVSDGCTDSTADIVRQFEANGVRLLIQEERRGKTVALNRAVKEANGEILVFSDSNSIYAPDAVNKLIRNFHDSSVGYVSGKMVYVDKTNSLVGSGTTAYMKYENTLRSLETRYGSVVGVDGGIDAVRKELYEPMEPDMLPDFVLPLTVVEKGYRVVYEEEALLTEATLSSIRDEFRMRVRVALRSFHALWYKRSMFNPLRSGFFAIQLLVHKLLRYLMGFTQLGLFVSNTFLIGSGRVYGLLFACQCLLYAFAMVGWVLNRRGLGIRLVRYPYYFCLLNFSSLWGFLKFMSGQRQTVWSPRKG